MTDFVADNEHPIKLTEPAIEMVKEAIRQEGQPNDALRVAIVGGGCSGYSYSLDFEQEKRKDDIVITYEDLTVYIDPISASYLKGTVIDYISSPEEAGFKFNNPNPPRRTCSHCSHC